MTISSTSAIRTLLILFLVCAGLFFARSFFIPFTLGGVLATLFLPLCRWQEKKGMPRGAAAIICTLSLIAGIVAISAVLGWQMKELAKDAGMLRERILVIFGEGQKFIFDHFGISIARQDKIFKAQHGALGGMIKDVFGSIASIGVNALFMLAYLLFLLFYRSHIKRFLLMLSPSEERQEMNKVVNSVANVSQQYLVGLLKMIGCLWIMYGVGFSVIGIENALFFAFLCGLLEIVPFIGNLTGTSITVLVAAAQGGSQGVLVAIVATYAVVQFVQGWLLEPLMLGPQVRVNPLFTIIALVVGELLWGIAGIFLAIPLMAMFKIVCDNIEQLKPFGYLIGETKSVERNLK
jgi:predicted PurR-regulated permease PerM